MSDRKDRLTITVDPLDPLDRLRETTAHADPAKVSRMMAHIDAQAAALPDR